VLIALLAFSQGEPTRGDRVVDMMSEEFVAFAATTAELEAAVATLDCDSPGGVLRVREALKRCRLQYKRIEFFLEYFFDFAARAFNAPPKMEVEEPSMEFNEPAGLQVIEALIFSDDPFLKKGEMAAQARFIASSAQDLRALLYAFNCDGRQLFESIRLELIRVMTLAIAGYDAPILKTGIQESHESLSSIAMALEPWLAKKGEVYEKTRNDLSAAIHYLELHPDFDTFDRLSFLTDYGFPLQRSLNSLIEDAGLRLNTVPAVNYGAANPFSGEWLRPGGFSTAAQRNESLIALGRSLFFERGLSGDRSRSCATCHDPEKYFTDGLTRSRAFNGKSFVPRNAPTLLYAALQHSQFWDGRVRTLEEQTKIVLTSPLEMNGSRSVMKAVLKESSEYVASFHRAFPHEADSAITFDNIAHAIASFVRTLQPYSSPFDQYMRGDRGALNASQIRGFNLFMGKAACGTCHFPPLFNGLVPPLYALTEFESLGVPQNGDVDHPVPDQDEGRFTVLHVDFQKGAFKTPTLRNVAVTAPYMHNGSFASLEKVMDFYDRGGGAGIGMKVPNQTLPPQPLHLTAEERSDIIAFLKALTDDAAAGTHSSTISTQQ
jgi:cytochrome c peroxidase